jgi:hypothetical protein
MRRAFFLESAVGTRRVKGSSSTGNLRGQGAAAWRYYSHPSALTVAVGPANSDDAVKCGMGEQKSAPLALAVDDLGRMIVERRRQIAEGATK